MRMWAKNREGRGEALPGVRRSSQGRDWGKLRSVVLRWFSRSRRDLPWRKTSDPYRVWISETMLQQTRIQTVLPYYDRFIVRFPNVAALARAPEQEVLRLWSGLGYYSRARNLLRAAQVVVEENKGGITDSFDAIIRLPGIGRYTAGAVLSIAFHLPYPVVDGNVSRVLARLFRIPGDPKSAQVGGLLWEKARELLSEKKPGDFNQALMEIGSLICTPRKPNCDLCPLGIWCQARDRGEQEDYPPSAPRPPAEREQTVRALVWRDGFLLLRRRATGRLLAGLWEFPWGPCRKGEAPRRAVARHLRSSLPFPVQVGEPVGEVKHHIAPGQILSRVFSCTCRDSVVMEPADEEWRWVAPGEITRYPLASADLKVLDLLRGRDGPPPTRRKKRHRSPT